MKIGIMFAHPALAVRVEAKGAVRPLNQNLRQLGDRELAAGVGGLNQRALDHPEITARQVIKVTAHLADLNDGLSATPEGVAQLIFQFLTPLPSRPASLWQKLGEQILAR